MTSQAVSTGNVAVTVKRRVGDRYSQKKKAYYDSQVVKWIVSCEWSIKTRKM